MSNYDKFACALREAALWVFTIVLAVIATAITIALALAAIGQVVANGGF